MKRIIHTIAIVLLAFLAGCELEPEVQISANPVSPELLVPTSGYAYKYINENKEDEIQFVFTSADYGFKAPISYTIQIDLRGSDFARPRNLVFGASDTLTVTADTFNKQVIKLKFKAGETAELDMRVTSSVSEFFDDFVSPVIPISFVVL